MSKISDHPTAALIKRLEEQDKKIRDLSIDVAVLKDLLIRTVKMLARHEALGNLPPLPKRGPKLVK